MVGEYTPNGYGQFRSKVKRKTVLAHRYFYELLKGPIPDGFQIDHLCLNKPCVNPSHMEIVTPKENKLRYVALLTHCPQNHPYNKVNTYTRPNGSRYCRVCVKIKVRETRFNNWVARL